MIKTRTFITLLHSTAFDPGEQGWKKNAEGAFDLKDGNPVYVDSSGRESVVDFNTISNLNREAKTHREAKEAAETKLKVFDGIDPELARKALETVSKIDAKKLIDAGEVDKVRDTIKNEFTAQIGEKDKTIADLQATIDGMHINSVFANSEFLRKDIALPLDMIEAYFRGNFKMENGKIVAYYKDGNPVMSKENGSIGSPASPEEALRLLIDAHPQKDIILKAPDSSGTGGGGGGGNRGGGRTIKRSDFEKLSPVAQAETAAKVRTGEMQLVD